MLAHYHQRLLYLLALSILYMLSHTHIEWKYSDVTDGFLEPSALQKPSSPDNNYELDITGTSTESRAPADQHGSWLGRTWVPPTCWTIFSADQMVKL